MFQTFIDAVKLVKVGDEVYCYTPRCIIVYA